MTTSAKRILWEARETRVFSAAAWSIGDHHGPWDHGTIGTVYWDGPEATEGCYWDLASLTKPIVATAIFSLIEDGLLTLEQTVGETQTNYADDGSMITVGQLLTHTSGLPGGVPLFRTCSSTDEMLDAVRKLPLSSPPGERCEYSSPGFILLGQIAEEVTGQPLNEVVQDRILRPLGMMDTSFGVPFHELAHAVATENDPWRGHVVQGEVHDENAKVIGKAAGHAGIFSTLPDMERFAHAVALASQGEETEIIGCEAFRLMTSLQTGESKDRWAHGWMIAGDHLHGRSAGTRISSSGFGHTGFTGTSLWVDPSSGRYSLLLTNRVHPTRHGDSIENVRIRMNDLAFAT